eukprot:jgi/Astpho2/578/fgenesh1_pg.00013_%23_13_t
MLTQSSKGVFKTVLATIAVVVGTGVANRVLYKLALVPMGDYVFVLSQFQTFGYVLVYASLLAARLRSGEVDREQIDVTDKRLFLGIGALEAASSLLGFIGASRLPGKHFLCSSPVDPLYAGIFISSMAFPALASIFKEKIFAEAKEKMNGKPLDIFVVNTLGSGAQALCVLLLLPVLVSLRGLSLTELPQYVSDGAVVQSLTNSSLTPLTIYAFTFSLPYLGTAPELGPQFAAGSTLLVAGLLTFNSDKWRPALMKRLKQSK